MIFRYFIEWLRIELREEAFQGYVKRAKRKAQSLKKQQHQHQQYQKHQKQKAKNPSKLENDSGWAATLPGWVTSTLADVSAEVDEWFDWLTDEEKTTDSSSSSSSDEDDDDKDYRQSQLWELAKLEGDEKWIEWLQTHIWTVRFLCYFHRHLYFKLEMCILFRH